MRLRAVLLGVVGGLGLGITIAGLLGRAAAPPVLLGEDSGRITRVVLHYQPEAAALAAPIYAQFLTALGPEAEVVWVVARKADLDGLRARLGRAWPARSRCVEIGKPISTWAKDRCVALRLPGRDAALLCAPARHVTASPLRTNDQETPYRLAQVEAAHFRVIGSDLDFDGGDFLATRRHLFASPLILAKNPGTTALAERLGRVMGRKVTWLADTPDAAPPHHVGMFLTIFGDTAAVGDLRPAERLLATHPEIRAAMTRAGGPLPPADRTRLQRQCDGVAARMRTLGYRVVRVPLLPSATPRAWMSYNNGIVDQRDGRTVFYMPTFGAPPLDAAAAKAFRAAGCTVIPIDCAGIWHLGGSLHCLVNVVARKNY
jgi:hypothetical protein